MVKINLIKLIIFSSFILNIIFAQDGNNYYNGNNNNQQPNFNQQNNERLNYDMYSIPSTPGATLDLRNKQVLYQNEKLSVDGFDLSINPNGFIQLTNGNDLVWQSNPPIYGQPFQLRLNTNYNLCLYNYTNIPVWCSDTILEERMANDNDGYFTLLQSGAYNREWGLAIVSGGMMKWGRFGELQSASIPLIPGSFLDCDDAQGGLNKLMTGEYITNGRDYLIVNNDGTIKLNIIKDKKTLNVFTAPNSQQYPVSNGYSMIFEEGGTMVMYSSLPQYQPVVYRVHVTNGRYLQLVPRGANNEWSIIIRSDRGQVVGGYFSDPTEMVPVKPNTFISQTIKSGDWSGSPLVSDYLNFTVDPNVKLRKYFDQDPKPYVSSLDIKLNSNISPNGIPKTIFSVKNDKVSVFWGQCELTKKPTSWTSDGRFKIEIHTYCEVAQGFGTQATHRDTTLFLSPFASNSNKNALVLLQSMPELVHIKCDPQFCGSDQCGCSYVYGVSGTLQDLSS